jgi:hypothetical protein
MGFSARRLASRLVLLLAILLAAPASSLAQAAAESAGAAFPIDDFVIDYSPAQPDLPALSKILPIRVRLRATEDGWAAAEEDEIGEWVAVGGPRSLELFHPSAIGAVARTLLRRLHEEDLIGIYVRPRAEDIDIVEERDLRPAGDHSLHIDIWVGRIEEVRSIALGDRVDANRTINNPLHRRIRNQSPLGPILGGRIDSTSLLDRRKLEDYVHFLNRHPGRYVEASLAASEGEEGITLDYRIYEQRSWSLYAQASNTGSERTAPWQTRVGYINRQLTDRDDILSIDYLNAGLDKVQGIRISYEAPFFDSRRPGWLEPSERESKWISWLNRDKIPWWGVERLRWGIDGGFTHIKSDLSQNLGGGFSAADSLLSDDWNVGGHFRYNFFQHRSLFVDLGLGARFRGLKLDNESAGNRADVTLLLLDARIDIERSQQTSRIFASLTGQHASPLGESGDYQSDFGGGLGRAATDDRWWLLKFDGGLSFYLEPLLFGSSWRDPSSRWSSTLSHEVALGGRGQYGFDYRLIPQSSQVIGGLYSVRGFEESVAVGDSVYIGSVEYRFHLPRALPIRRRPARLPWIGDFRVAPQQVYGRPDWDLIFRGFVDTGKSIRNRPELASGTELDQFLVGAGVGVEFAYKGNLRVRVDWARGIHQDVSCDPVAPSGLTDRGCVEAMSDSEIDPDGRFYFLLNGVW